MYLIGYDIGSSSIKAALVDATTKKQVAICQSPTAEMKIDTPKAGWAEQNPELWWEHVCKATQLLQEQHPTKIAAVKGIGIAYQMHGLVLVDKDQKVLRPSIIWCDSRAVKIGDEAFAKIGEEHCLSQLLNSPGNFTASKLKWVKDYEPSIYKRIHKFMLPGDFIAMKLTGKITTTTSGLSEGMFWDFKSGSISKTILEHYGIDEKLIPEIKPTFSKQGMIKKEVAEDIGLPANISVAYRAGDQPNNALSLNVLQPGEVAATGGTSGVVYAVVDRPIYDLQSRVNGFAHVNYTKEQERIGILLCINGAGIQYRWLQQQVAESGMSYEAMEQDAEQVPVGSDGLRILPFGNGAERILSNKDIGAQINNLDFNRHTRAHLFRAGLEGIAFAFVYGMRILQELGLNLSVIRVGNDNLFQSKIFATTIATLMDAKIEVHQTTGAVGAAKAAGVATGVFPDLETALGNSEIVETYFPETDNVVYENAYLRWEGELKRMLVN